MMTALNIDKWVSNMCVMADNICMIINNSCNFDFFA